MRKLKIAALHCFGSNPQKHATQRYHFRHCTAACDDLAEWFYPAAPNTVAPDVVRSLLGADMGCTADEVEAFGYEDPRCWFRFVDGRYVGLEASMEALAAYCRRERPDGIAGYSNGAAAAMLVAAAHEAGNESFESIRFVMSFAGPTSAMMQSHVRTLLGSRRDRISIPAILFGSRRDPMLERVNQFARDFFARCDLAVVDEARPYANHALPDRPEAYASIVKFLRRQASAAASS
jgi:hypothetical protein